jgi:hypothetical protein
MLVTFFIAFTWNIVSQPLLPSSLESNLMQLVLLLKLMPLYTVSFSVTSYTLLIHVLIFSLFLVLFPIYAKPHEIHWKETKRILWCVWGTVQFGIHYNSMGTPLLVCLTDLDWVDDPDDRKYIAGYVFSLGLGPITWAYKKQ